MTVSRSVSELQDISGRLDVHIAYHIMLEPLILRARRFLYLSHFVSPNSKLHISWGTHTLELLRRKSTDNVACKGILTLLYF